MTKLGHLYSRVSAKRQTKGGGLERQDEGTRRYVEKHDITVVREYSDRGLSAFRGANSKVGELKLILDHIEAGVIRPGEAIIIESVDRLSRQPPLDALEPLKAILRAGVEVHSVLDGRAFTLETVNTDLGMMIGLLVGMARAHEESKTKSYRVADRYQKGRQTGAIISGTVPTWVTVVKDPVTGTKAFAVKKDVAKIVNDIFEMSASGLSSYRIGMELKKLGIRPFGKPKPRLGSKVKIEQHEWNSTSVLDLLTRRAVLGEFRSHTTSYDPVTGKRKLTLASVNPNYYPEVVPPDLWQKANDAIQLRKRSRSRGRVGVNFTNLLKDIAVCIHCGRAMHIKTQKETRNGERFTRFRCAGRNDNVCVNAKTPRVMAVEAEIVRFVSEIDISDARSEEAAQLQRQIAAATLAADGLREQALQIVMNYAGSTTMVTVVKQKEAEAEKLEVEAAELRGKLAVIEVRESAKDRAEAFERLRLRMNSAEGDELFKLRAELNLRIKQVIEKVTFNKDGEITIHIRGQNKFYLIEPKGQEQITEAAIMAAAATAA